MRDVEGGVEHYNKREYHYLRTSGIGMPLRASKRIGSIGRQVCQHDHAAIPRKTQEVKQSDEDISTQLLWWCKRRASVCAASI